MSTEKTYLHLEDLGDKVKVEMNGKGGDLINLLCQAIVSEPNIRQLVELSLMAVISNEMENESEDDLIKMLSKMKVGVA